MNDPLEQRVGHLKEGEGKHTEESEEDMGPLLGKMIIGFGIYWGICAGVAYLRNHPEVYQPIIDYFK